MLYIGVLGLLSALGLLALLVLQPSMARLSSARLGFADESALSALGRRLSSSVDDSLHRRSWSPVTALDLEMAAVSSTVGTFLVTVGALAFAAFGFVTTLVGSPMIGLMAAGAVLIAAKAVLGKRAEKRRAAFGEQLDPTLQLLASALRAGHSLPSALHTTARDSESPTAEEFTRLVNETRIGRDLVEAMHTTADRMDNDDMHWLAEAVAVQRETGGNLNEVLDRVGETIRERRALQREIRSLSAEGRGSAVVLLILPVAVGLMQLLRSPETTMTMVTTSTGRRMLVLSAVLYVVGLLWMSRITKVKV